MALTEITGTQTATGKVDELFAVGDGTEVKHYAALIKPTEMNPGDEYKVSIYTWDNVDDIYREYITQTIKFTDIEPMKIIKGGIINSIEIGHNKKVLLNLFGWKVGWLGTYIMFSIIFSILIRRIIKVY